MKQLTTILLSLILLLALSACTNRNHKFKDNNEPNTNLDATVQDEQQSSQQANKISREEAIDIALSHAGVTKDTAFDIEADLDHERNGIYWEVDFESGQYEYSYDIDATNGTIILNQKEARD